MPLDNRKKEVLHAIVDDYVSTNEPVGSKSLIERHNFQVSSATLRNDMAELEHMGLIEKPHTSAGRIPSDKGYREYVNSLMTIEELSPKEQLEIEKRIDSSVNEVTDLIKNATYTLSEATGFVSLAMSPRLKKSFLKQLKILMIEPGKALVVMVLSAGVVKDKVVRIPNFLSDAQIMKISGAIEKNLTGKPLDEITLVTVESAGKGTEVPEPLLKQVLYEAYAAIKQADELNIYLEGEHRMLGLPDFSSMGRARDLLGTLSDSGMVAGYVNEMENSKQGADDSFMIRIGQEITLEGLDDCSFITATYNLTDSVSGNIGVIGPKRMLYSKVISQIDFVKKKLDKEMRNFI
ncbi:heat-inducible transcriptional repressor HrcA [Butyrivibrio sp. AE2032]|uniref:heat-inducible transcriptional repressor HrcA n=1 Tax=Butyrivibrio sp. AE2032 TaxID=1458463 RepID=UPI00068A5063|nr:heat-inducible transcriptional repressor HrcA [Butyrivibrio sp. AE2032]